MAIRKLTKQRRLDIIEYLKKQITDHSFPKERENLDKIETKLGIEACKLASGASQRKKWKFC